MINRSLIGSTDIAAILGVSKYRSAWAVQRRILGLDTVDDWSPEMLRGLALEAPVARKFSTLSGLTIEPLERVETPHGRRWQRCSFDFASADGGLVEVKTASAYAYASAWGAEPDGVPQDYLVQTQAQLEVTRRPHAWVPVLVVPESLADLEGAMAVLDREQCAATLASMAALYLALGEVRVYRVERDDEVGAAIVAACESWWARHIERRVLCEPSAVDGDAIKALHPVERDPPRDASEVESRDLDAYLEARAMRDAAAETVDEIGARLRLAMGDAESIIGDGVRATYRAQSPRTDWKAVASEALSLCGLHGVATREIVAKHTDAAGSRVLKVSAVKARKGE